MSTFSPFVRFVRLPDETNPGVIQSVCLCCNRLIAASREKKVLDIAQRIHACQIANPENLQLREFSNQA